MIENVNKCEVALKPLMFKLGGMQSSSLRLRPHGN